MSLVEIDYDGDARRALMAQCLSDDGRKYCISFADVQIPPHTAAYRYLAAYCRWLGIEPVGLFQEQGRREPSGAAKSLTGPAMQPPDVLVEVLVKVGQVYVIIRGAGEKM